MNVQLRSSVSKETNMFNDLDSMNSELHRKDLLRQSETARLINSAKPSNKCKDSRSIDGWVSLQAIASLIGFIAHGRSLRHR